MEACGASHHWASQLQARRYHARLIAGQFVKSFVKINKNDVVDAQAICEATRSPSMHFVTIKTIALNDLQATNRVRSELMRNRTVLTNQVRGLVGDYGVVALVGIGELRRTIPCCLADAENGLSVDFRALLIELYEDLQRLDERVEAQDTRIAEQAKRDPVAQQLLSLRGVGPSQPLHCPWPWVMANRLPWGVSLPLRIA